MIAAKKVTSLLLLGNLVVFLGVANWITLDKEDHLAMGRMILLEIAPRDPRSLMQGDYMILRYQFGRDIPGEEQKERPSSGTLIARLDQRGVATFSRFEDGAAPGADEVRLRYAPSQRTRGTSRGKR